jgi:cell division protein FtsI (penicillin-binding protein 3)
MNYHVDVGIKIRMAAILALLGIGAIGVVLRAFQLQVLEARLLKEKADQQRRHTIEIMAKRGDILDARGEALAVSKEKAQIYARPEEIKDPARTAKELASILGLDRKRLEAKLVRGEHFFWVTRQASLEQAEAVRRLRKKNTELEHGIGVLPASARLYPGYSLAANLIGFTGIGEKGDAVGLEGLEYLYEDTLKGKPIHIWLEKDARGNPFYLSGGEGSLIPDLDAEKTRKPAEPIFKPEARGTSLKLTILRPLQYLVERELEKGIKASKAKAGCVVAMEPDTGRILAMASYPTFDPNRYNKYSQEEFRNRCAAIADEPGSTFKVFIAAAALEERVVKKNQIFFCENGMYMLGGETISDTRAHGWLTVGQIITYSSNIGATKIGEALGKERMHRAIKAFGFGSRTGVDFPGESAGILRPTSQWSQVAVGTISFGQGIAASPLQMVTALSAIANRGVLMKPYLVESLISPDGAEKILHRPQSVRRVITEETAGTVTAFMNKVVAPGGTGAKAAVPGYTVSGKTGTAQKPREKARGYAEGKYVASFMGFLPAKRPRLAMVVLIDEPDPERPWGGAVAAPVFQAIAKQAMVLLKVPSENEYQHLAEIDLERSYERNGEDEFKRKIRKWEKARNWKKTRTPGSVKGQRAVPDLRGLTMRQALKALEGLPVGVETSGSGIVRSVTPSPGTKINRGDIIRLRLEMLE